jgi:hypothetical protein
MAPKKTLAHPRSAVEIAESLTVVRGLIGVADQQITNAVTDLGIAGVRLAEIETELTTRGLS